MQPAGCFTLVAKNIPELVRYKEELQRLDPLVQDRELLWIFSSGRNLGSAIGEFAADEGVLARDCEAPDDEFSQATSQVASGDDDLDDAASCKTDCRSDSCSSVPTSGSASWLMSNDD